MSHGIAANPADNLDANLAANLAANPAANLTANYTSLISIVHLRVTMAAW
jgi:hypothetical protein